MTNPTASSRVDRNPARPADRTCQFQRLVEASFPKAQGMQRQGNDQVRRAGLGQRGELSAKPACQSQSMSILERLNQLVDREAVAKDSAGDILSLIHI